MNDWLMQNWFIGWLGLALSPILVELLRLGVVRLRRARAERRRRRLPTRAELEQLQREMNARGWF
jgi:hypothetical protein